jgi:broad specificity phosphatase PhoE
MDLTVIHLVRHGYVHNPDQIMYGRLPRFRLSAAGRDQARAAGEYLSARPVQAVFSSPMLRARLTAREILVFFPDLTLRRSVLLNEVSTAYEGWPSATVDRKGDIYEGVGDGFERPQDILRRGVLFLRRSHRRYAGKHVVAVTHGDVITFTVLWALGWEPTASNKTRLKQAGYGAGYPGHASVTSLVFHTDSAEERPALEYVQSR